MAVEKEKVKARLKALFPKANLTATRLDAIAAKLAPKPEDGADDEAIDKVINDFNENSFMSIEDIAREDDRMRTLTRKATGGQEPDKGKGPADEKGKEDSKTEDPMSIILNELKGLKAELEGIKTTNQRKSIEERFRSQEKLKGVPEFLLKRSIPQSEDEFDAAVEELANEWSSFRTQHKLSEFGNDNPGKGANSTEPKQADRKVTDQIAKNLLKQ